MTCRVALVMGSESDWPTLEPCLEQLGALGIEADVQVLSAHRTPDALAAYVAGAPEQGVCVFIAAAGMSAALPGAIAAHTTLPVIGVPVPSGTLQGTDALLAMSQMPPGVPVATMAIGAPGARNAAILAAQILALSDTNIAQKLREHKRMMAEKADKKNQGLRGRIFGR